MKSWVEVKNDSDFPIQNLPFGIFKTKQQSPRVGIAIGEYVVDLAELFSLGILKEGNISVYENKTLNSFIALGKPVTKGIRKRISDLLEEKNSELRDNADAKAKTLHKMSEVEMLLPVEIGDYTDFYSSEQHAFNVGSMFRDPANALMPNWKHLPVGYHGRASSIVVSGTDFHRPKGQTKPADVDKPLFGPTKQLDFELEVAFIVGKETKLGESISTKNAEDYIFGLVLFNDWSARDIQAWEYVPLGPFLAKNFCSSISPWIVTLEALEPFRVAGAEQNPKVLPYLEYEGLKNYNINLDVALNDTVISKSNFKYMYWNMCQQLAHHTVNGCNIRVGDMMASGTISGPEPGSYGSMLEITWRGAKPVKLKDGSERKFINDNDTLTIRGYGENNGVRIGFGEVKGRVLSAL
ncbi:MAG TPA: fumarylacetoacetase [Bacteroidia bacterium]|nr:fumarylacetoacetase [Bacteroidia bacterium]